MLNTTFNQSISALVKKRCARARAEKLRSRSPFWKKIRSRSWQTSAAHFLRSSEVNGNYIFLVKFLYFIINIHMYVLLWSYLTCSSWKQQFLLDDKVWKSILFTWKSVWLKVIDERKKWAQICARTRQFLDALPLALMNLANGRAHESIGQTFQKSISFGTLTTNFGVNNRPIFTPKV